MGLYEKRLSHAESPVTSCTLHRHTSDASFCALGSGLSSEDSWRIAVPRIMPRLIGMAWSVLILHIFARSWEGSNVQRPALYDIKVSPMNCLNAVTIE